MTVHARIAQGIRSVGHRLVRAPLRMLPPAAVVPIMSGPAAGRRWVVGSATHGCWLGSYERDKQVRFAEDAARATVVFDIGANVGFYTLVAATRPGRPAVFAFEPLPRNVQFLHRHASINGLDNVTIVEAAVADTVGTARFDPGPHASMGHLDGGGSLAVRSTTIDALVLDEQLPMPDLIKIDVEGAELQVLTGADRVVRHRRPILYVATHAVSLHAGCLTWLAERGYDCDDLGGDEIIARPAGQVAIP